jgi:alkylated DNA repair dioxygenase AlkB
MRREGNKDMTTPVAHHLAMPDADVILYPDFFGHLESDAFFQTLRDEIAWKQEIIKFWGKTYPLPRLTALYGDAGKSYAYSGIIDQARPWTPTLRTIKQRLEELVCVPFNTVLLNHYRDGQDSVSWHSDSEASLGTNPVIASVSFGATRRLRFKHQHDHAFVTSVELTHGSVLLMQGPTQHFWFHALPKTRKPCSARINLTFRVVH